MIDERLLADPRACPDCHATLSEPTSCGACGLALTGNAASQLWELSRTIVDLLDRRSRLLAQLRASGATVFVGVTPAPTAAALLPSGPPSAPPAAGPEWTRERVRNLLLALG